MRKSVLIVDDQISNVSFTKALLESHYEVFGATSANEAKKQVQKHHPDVILLDIMMPEVSGLEFAHEIRKEKAFSSVPIIFLTGDSSDKSVKEAMSIAYTDYLLKPIKFEKIHKRIENILEHSIDAFFEHAYLNCVHMMDDYFKNNLVLDFENVHRHVEKLVEFINKKHWHLGKLFQKIPKGYDVASHSTNVAVLAIILGKSLHYNIKQLMDVGVAGLLHDIGKINVDKDILEKKTQLHWSEYEKVKKHSEYSMDSAKQIGVKSEVVLLAILHHHEKMDGTGYPKGLRENKIPIYAQILSICDVFDALICERDFRSQYSSFDALKLMRTQMSGSFNENLLINFIKLLH